MPNEDSNEKHQPMTSGGPPDSQTAKGTKGDSIQMSAYGFPTFRCARPVNGEDVKALDDEE
ncbi:MAG: hypothetical protein HY820_09880 [Acidobacteria bacterium]|nr:hypothetical protein [Acidobacteriota bacterium]